jgi:hypothetical protein
MAELVNSFKIRKFDLSLHVLGVSLLIVSIYTIWSTSYEIKDSSLSFGKITTCKGSCKYRTPDDYFWLDARANQSVVDKSLVFTPGQSKATVLLNSGSKLTLYPNSLVQITHTQKGTTIDIIEGKINFEKSRNSNGFEKLTIKGQDLKLEPGLLNSSEIAAVPELLNVSTPEVLLLVDSEVNLDVNINNGLPPFELTLEEQGEEKNLSVKTHFASFKLKKPGLYSLKIKDFAGEISTKFISVEDLRVPTITSPREGDIVYAKKFQLLGSFDADFTEIKLTSNGREVFFGDFNRMPDILENGKTSIQARIKRGGKYSEWSQLLNFDVVQTVLPQFVGESGEVFISNANLKWRKALPVIHKLIIRESSGREVVSLTTNSETHVFPADKSGLYQWTVEPLFNETNERPVWHNFTLINPIEFLISPSDKSIIVSEEIEENVNFSWIDISKSQLNLFLEIRGKEFKKRFNVSQFKNYNLDLPVLKNYKWKIVVDHKGKEIETPEFSFYLDAPPPSEAIKSNEILIKD